MFNNIDIDYIIDRIIDENFVLSAKYGLKIRPSDLKKEREVIKNVFNSNLNTINYDNYESNQRRIYMIIFDRLKDIVRYYFDNTPDGEVKTKYHIHLEYCVFDIYRELYRVLNFNI